MKTQKEKPKVCALAMILHEAGFSWQSSDELVAQVDRLTRPGCSSDDVAAALLSWRRKHGRSCLRAARVRAQHLLDRTNDREHEANNKEYVYHEGDCPVDEYAVQLDLYETVDETMARVRALAKAAAEAVQRSESC